METAAFPSYTELCIRTSDRILCNVDREVSLYNVSSF